MKGKIFLFLFALPFFGVGVWMGYAISSHLYDAWQMQNWVPVDATLHQAGYETHSGDDSNTYEAHADYSYTFNGRLYFNNRVSIAGGADNIGDYQQDLGRLLSSAMSRGQTIVVVVNPENPAEAIIDPSLRWGLLGFKGIFFLVFGGAGLGMLIFVFRAPKEKDATAPQYQDSPWLINDDWQTEIIRSSSKSSMWFAWGFAAFWNLVSAPLSFVIYEEVLEKDNTIALVGLLFPLIGIGLITWAIQRTLEWRRFGPAPVSLDPFPGSIGGHVGGTIDVNLPYDPGTRFSVTLTSLHSYVSGSGDSRSRKESAKWQDAQVAHSGSGAKGTRLSFRFDVPDGLSESDADQGSDSYDLWRLNLNADLPGADMDRDYEIPVYATAENSRRLSNFAISEAKSEQKQVDMDVIRDLIRLGSGISGKSMLYPMGRHLWNGIVGFIFGAAFAGIGWFLLVKEELWFMGGVFGLVGSLILVSAFYYLFNSLEVIQQGSNIRTVRRLLGIPVRTREMRRYDFVRFEKKSSMSTQSGSKHVMHYTIYALGSTGQKLVVGEGFKGASQADAAAELIASEFGLTPKIDSQNQDDAFGELDFLAAD